MVLSARQKPAGQAGLQGGWENLGHNIKDWDGVDVLRLE